jgi:ribonucleotide reductase alpha subunit
VATGNPVGIRDCGTSNGIVPFLKTLDAGVAAVHQGGRRKGAACVYLEPWPPDIEEFLELRDNTGILEVNSGDETAVCNLGSINLGAHIDDGGVDWEQLCASVRTAIGFLDRVIDINDCPSPQAAASNPCWRPVGLGLMGLQDAFFRLGLPFDSAQALELSTRVQEKAIAKHGLRNSLLIAIAPTATIASIAGCYECIEPQVSNLFKRETMSASRNCPPRCASCSGRRGRSRRRR